MNRAPPASNQLTAPVTLSLPCYAGLAAYKATGNQDAVSARDDLAGNMTTAQLNQAQASAHQCAVSFRFCLSPKGVRPRPAA